MPRTRADLVSRTAKVLGILAAGQTLSAEDNESIDAEIKAMAATLEAEEIYRLPSVDEIEDDAFLWLAHVLAVTCCSDFGLSEEGLARKGVTRANAEMRLRVISSIGPTGATLKADYF